MSQQLIFDTSIWVDFFRDKSTPESDLLSNYIEEDEPILLVPAIIQEILQGIKDDSQYRKIKDSISYFPVLEIPPVKAATGAADLYRSIRKKGLTIRKSNDCLIAYHAIQFSIPLVHKDSDFDQISKHSTLKVWKGRT